MQEPREGALPTVEGESGMTYDQRVVPDIERGGESTAVVPPDGVVYIRPSEGE